MPSSRANYSIGVFIPLLAVALWVGSATTATSASDTQRAASPAPSKIEGPPPAAAPTLAVTQTGERVGDDTCLTCHEKEGQAYGKTAHARVQDPRSPAAAQGCETCHGPGKAHVDADGDKTKIKVFTALSPQQVSDTCVTCHNRQEHANWEGSAHNGRNLSCVTCHSVHAPRSEKAQLKKVSVTETCETCHRTEANKLHRSAHMPVREGKMECSSCHNPHGSNNVRLLRVGNTINETCVSCHTEKRGPFLWDHAPVRDNCTSCHDPHGSNNERLLVAKAPMLCQRCHVASRHPATIYDANQVLVSKSSRVVGRSCVNCHAQIHGSNHPSGVVFTR
ncbi:MAG: DmsE family decaheme c-type cytochrome [Acidobacteria bacterium]|nr:DmsE family decaheme c-type cytochrome [Acidobacteriota bacterium]